MLWKDREGSDSAKDADTDVEDLIGDANEDLEMEAEMWKERPVKPRNCSHPTAGLLIC